MNLRNENGTMNWSDADETIFNRNHKIGVEELTTPFREISFHQLMTEFCDDYKEYDADEFAVVWNEYHGEVHIQQIYNHIFWQILNVDRQSAVGL